MAYASITSLFKGICDAIRSKDGTSAKIDHQDIPARIRAISTGGNVSLQSKSVTPSEQAQTVVADDGYTGLSRVDVGAVSPDYIGSAVPRKTKQTYTPGTSDQTIAGGQYLTGVQTIKAVSLQEKTVTPSQYIQEITPDSGNTGLSKVTVDPIPPQYVYPYGTKYITQNGTADIRNYEYVDVDVPTGGSGLREYDDSFTTDWNGEATVNCGFKPDFITVPLGVYQDPGYPDEEYNLCINCKAAATTGERLVTQGYLFDGSGIVKMSVIPNASGFRVLMESLDWGWGVGVLRNKTYNFTAIKYEE